METFLFASESVTEGHPDKLCDQISDAILDACLEQDAESKVDCEACVKSDSIAVIGEITTKARVNYEKIARDTCRSAGYAPPPNRFGLDPDSCRVLVSIEPQNPDVAEAVHGNLTKPPEEIGAGDQGHMFGYATDETPEYMPLSHSLASRLAHRLAEVRKDGTFPWLGPYGKTEVVVEHRREDGAVVPVGVRTILIVAQHDETKDTRLIERELKERVVLPVVPDRYLDGETAVRFDLFGPGGRAFTGLTGRKIVADAYGGWGAHGGGAFSGKDATKVHRTGAYVARRAAKSVVASGLARRCLVQVAYGIGMAEPLSVFVDTYGTGKVGDREVLKMVRDNFDFRPGIVAAELDLKRGGNFRYQKTASYGHFGRDDPDFTWENVKLLAT